MGTMKPTVAIVTRTKDRPIFLKRALKSVRDQDYDDYVHVIVNDGGDRKELERVLKGVGEVQRKKTQVFHRVQSSGAPDTIFNESIDRIDSLYFAIHDDDDTWHPNFLSTTVQYLEDNVSDAAVVVAAEKVIEVADDNQLHEKKRVKWMDDLSVVNLYRQCIDNQLTPIATLFRRSAYESVGKFDASLPVVGDWEFGVRLLSKYDVGFIASPTLAYYHHRLSDDNSFSVHSHRHYTNVVMNRYLRAELDEGRLGVGYIMSNLKYNQSNIHTYIKKALPNFIVNKIRKHRR